MSQFNSNELEKLVAMAENVSETVNELHAKRAKLKTTAVISLGGIYLSLGTAGYLFTHPYWLDQFPWMFYISLIIFLIFTGVISSIYTYQSVNFLKLVNRDLHTEVEILEKLIRIVYEYRDNVADDALTYVEKTILDMKLQRIQLSSK